MPHIAHFIGADHRAKISPAHPDRVLFEIGPVGGVPAIALTMTTWDFHALKMAVDAYAAELGAPRRPDSTSVSWAYSPAPPIGSAYIECNGEQCPTCHPERLIPPIKPSDTIDGDLCPGCATLEELGRQQSEERS